MSTIRKKIISKCNTLLDIINVEGVTGLFKLFPSKKHKSG